MNRKQANVLFILICLLNALPVFWHPVFPTTDGAAHLYNSKILNDLLFNGGNLYSEYFAVNPEPVPNWTGHLFLTFLLGMGLNALMAEKILLLIYTLGIPFIIFRVFSNQGRDPLYSLMAVLSFPFIYNLMLGLGFYNFSLAILFLFLLINHFSKLLPLNNSLDYLKIFLILFLIYFSHLLVFFIATVFLGIFCLINLKKDFRKNKNYIWPLLMLLPFLAMGLIFITQREAPSADAHLGLSTLVEMFWKLQILEIFQLKELTYLNILLNFIILSLLVIFFVKWYRGKVQWNTFIQTVGITLLIVLLLYFIMPDSSSNGSYISPRLLLLLYFLIITLLSSIKLGKPAVLIFFLLIIGMQFLRLLPVNKIVEERSGEIIQLQNAVTDLNPGTVLLSIGHKRGTHQHHYPNYVGVFTDVIVLKNYEANYGYFPVIWNKSLPEFTIHGEPLHQKFFSWPSINQTGIKNINYLMPVEVDDEEKTWENFKIMHPLSYKVIFSDDNFVYSIYKLR